MNNGPPVQCSISIKDEPRERLLFESFPESLSEGYNTEFDVRSRSIASHTLRAFYKGGSFDSFPLDLTFVAGLHPGINRRSILNLSAVQSFLNDSIASETEASARLDSYLQEMEAKVRWLEALLFPKPKVRRSPDLKTKIASGDPPRTLITIGRFLTLEGVIGRFNVTWLPPFHPISARPYIAKVTMSLIRVANFYPDWYDIAEYRTNTTLSGEAAKNLESREIVSFQDYSTTTVESASKVATPYPFAIIGEGLSN